MKKLILLFLCFLFYGQYLLSQDKTSVYFKLAKSKLPDTAMTKLADYLINFEGIPIDSIVFIGYSDTIGDYDKNYNLSEKRAQNVIEYAMTFFPTETIYKWYAKGESTTEKAIEKNRKVDILIFKKKPPKIPKVVNVSCSQIDYDLLHRANVKYPGKIKPKRKYRKLKRTNKFRGDVTIRFEKGDLDTNKKYYYTGLDKYGQIEAVKINWQFKKSGIGWTQRKRYSAKIPYLSYHNNKIFTISESPCVDCQDTLSQKRDTTKVDTCLQTDRFLMQNIQYRRMFFRPNKMLARVPRDFINFNDTYYHGCNTNEIIRWGKKTKKFSYARIRIDDIYIRNITRNMSCCKSFQEESLCEKPVITLSRIQYPKGNSYLHGHIEQEFNDLKFRTNLGLSVTYDNFKLHYLIFAGMNTDKQFTALGRLQYSFFAYPVGYLAQSLTWGLLSMPAKINVFSKYYIGCDFYGFANSKQANLSQNFNLGYAYVNYTDEAFVRRIFIQGEYWNINNNHQGKFGIRVGILTKIISLKKTTF